MVDREDTGTPAGQANRRQGHFVESLIWSALVIAALLFIFGPVFGLRETGTQIRSRKIHEEHERRIKETLDLSERERRRSEEDIERARKELFGK